MPEVTFATDASTLPAAHAAGDLAFPASVAQQDFWYLSQLDPRATAANVAIRCQFTGPLEPERLKATLTHIIERHEILRTRFEEEGGELLQIVAASLEVPLPIVDLSQLPDTHRDNEARRLGQLEAIKPFALDRAPLIRTELLRLGHDSHILHLTIHHTLFDGASIPILLDELATIYPALAANREIPLPALPIQYGDFSVWQKDHIGSPSTQRQIEYWKSRLDGMTELDLPTDHPRPTTKSWRGDFISAPLPQERIARLQEIALSHGATLFHLLLAAFNILLHRYTGATDIAIGSPFAGRCRAETNPLIGVFINSLILRNDLSGDPTFTSLLRRVRDTVLEAVEHQDLPFGSLVRELRPDRDPGRNPLFQINFTHQISTPPRHFAGIQAKLLPPLSPGAIFDLNFFTTEHADGWSVCCDYSSDLFESATAQRMLGHFQQLLEEVAADPERPISALQILNREEHECLSHHWAGSHSDYPRDATIGELFEKIANATPDRIALVFGDQQLDYRQLHADATAIAHQLITTGLAPGELVGLCTRPSFETITGLLGIILAGAACVPLDPDYPAERFALLLEESGIRITLATPPHEQAFEKWRGKLIPIPQAGLAKDLTLLPAAKHGPSDPAYLLFTSGSTGKPKGVLIPHRGVIRLVSNNDFIAITPDETFLFSAPLTFDPSILEIWGPLLHGGRLVIPDRGKNLEAIAHAVRHHGVTTLWLTAGLFQVMIEEHAASLTGLRQLIAGGDVLSVPHVRRALELLPTTRLINGYGPTENTTFTTCHSIVASDAEGTSIPIGRPIANTTVVILDDSGRLLPVGIPGELHTGGDGLALGYHGDAALTAEKFIQHPNFGRLYKTGDLCRRLADGRIEFIGRRDHQVKVRGFRIELGEIEAVLASHPEVRQSKVAVRGRGAETKRILAWATVDRDSHLDAPTLDAWLAERLPSFLRPNGVAIVPAFPITPNGKIDAAALPDPAQAASSKAHATAPPANDLEQALATLWCELLGIAKVGRDDDFFALGGHSLMALRLFSRLHRDFGHTLPLAALLTHPTIARLATLLTPEHQSTQIAGGNKGLLVTLKQEGDATPLFCVHGGDGGVLFYRRLAELAAYDGPLHAIEARALSDSGPIPKSSVEETAAAYLSEILAIQAHGPFRLAGYSFGGIVAHEMACQLVGRGHQVDFLGLFDTQNPVAPAKRLSPFGRFTTFWRQQAHLPLATKFARLRSRIAEGIRTHHRVKQEVATAIAHGPAEAHSDLRRIQVREENWRATQQYHPRPFAGKITLFKAMTANDKIAWPKDYGWTELAKGGLDIIPVPGQHLSIFDEAHIQELATALSTSLRDR
ncbi:MAG: non-ribosomal peptide synthetase [Verrucomicrobia bacterium]|nr:MAG: non-ribosomal peptide synthetase [Verrucomicrobiota bacterium]TAE87678.1 MAG: non-ribosomal peptide synthetase [Verrucomicrobiota bacterium]TAF25387.1 MAG: non-ribosomal peptide synthetase [Verrucomicrobiota bacterium]TAF41174.1 MAG: non-ribosomal peptide synthetase [Verrucomicrobiota bacterium]